MSWEEITGVLVFVLLASLSFVIAYRQHRQKGFVFTNRWLFASEKERLEMDAQSKKTQYHIARNIFTILGIIFTILAINVLFWATWLFYIIYALAALVIIYSLIKFTVINKM